MCVQRFDDSLKSAIHTTYRISLRSSSMPEPRDPLLKVLIYLFGDVYCSTRRFGLGPRWQASLPRKRTVLKRQGFYLGRDRPRRAARHSNDPSAGSPTETLLRLLLPLNDRV